MTYFKFSIVLFFLVSTSAFIQEYHLPNKESNYRSLSSVDSEETEIEEVETKSFKKVEPVPKIKKVDPLDTFVRVESNQKKALILSNLLLKNSLGELDKKRLLNLVINNFKYVDKFEILDEENKRIVEYYLTSFKSQNDIVNYLFNKINLNKEDFLYFWKQTKNPELFSLLNKKYLLFLTNEYSIEDFYMIGRLDVYELKDYVEFVKKNLDRALKKEDSLIKLMSLEDKDRKETLLDYLFYTEMDNTKVQQLIFRYIDDNKYRVSQEENRWFLWYLMGHEDISLKEYRNHLVGKILDKINPNFAWTTNTPLRLAILREDIDLINLLVKKGASLSYRGKEYNSTPKTLLKEYKISHKIHTYSHD